MGPEILKIILTAAFALAETERASLKNRLLRLEARSRDQLVKKYGETDAWRGLADDNILTLCDVLDHIALGHPLKTKSQA